MKNLTINFMGLCLAMGLAGCQGVTFKDIGVNPPLPDDFKSRTVIKNSIDFRLNPESNIGLIIAPDAAGTYEIIGKPVLASGSVPQSSAFKDGEVYDAIIDSGAAMQGNYLAFAASLSSDQKAELHIVDATHAFVPIADIPDDLIFAIAATASSKPRYWIAELYISTVTKTNSTEESSTATSSGPAFGANGKVYAQDTVSSHDWVVAAKLINVDAYAAANNKPHAGPLPNEMAVSPLAAPRLAFVEPLGETGARAARTPRAGQKVGYTVLPPIELKRN